MSELFKEIREYLRLNLDYARLTAAEKLTILLTAIALAGLIAILAGMVVFFLAMAVAGWIAQSIGQAWSYFIVMGFFVVLLVLLIALRKKLVSDPVARFISKLFIKP